MIARLQVIITFYIFIFPHPPQVNKSQTHTPIVCGQNRSQWEGCSLFWKWFESVSSRWEFSTTQTTLIIWNGARAASSQSRGLHGAWVYWWKWVKLVGTGCGWCLWSVCVCERELALLLLARFVSLVWPWEKLNGRGFAYSCVCSAVNAHAWCWVINNSSL